MALAGPGGRFCHAGAWDCGNGAPPRLPRRRLIRAGWGEVSSELELFQGFWARSWWGFVFFWCVWWIFGEILMDFDRFLEDFDVFFGNVHRFWWILSSISIDWLIGGTGFVHFLGGGSWILQQIHLGLGTTTSTDQHDWDHWGPLSESWPWPFFPFYQHPDAPARSLCLHSKILGSLSGALMAWMTGTRFGRCPNSGVSHQPWPGIRSEYSLRYSNFVKFPLEKPVFTEFHQPWSHHWMVASKMAASARRFPSQGCPFIAMFDYPESMSCVWPGMD